MEFRGDCLKCGLCVKGCPKQALRFKQGMASFPRSFTWNQQLEPGTFPKIFLVLLFTCVIDKALTLL